MKQGGCSQRIKIAACALAAAALSISAPARAENHALILWIGTYAEPSANLPGIDLDAKAARQIALAMGVPPNNITELKNEQLAWKGMSRAIAGLTERIQPGDKVFVYYSGHGAQRANVAGTNKPCSEGLVTQDVQLYFDRELEVDLARLGAKASQVVMMNDSCFSGGASTKSVGSGKALVAKAYPGPVKAPTAASAAAAAAYACGNAVNKGLFTKNLQVVPREGARLLYIAASADNEISYASPEGSLATQAWAACIKDPATDKDRSGSINGEELRACAQARIDANTLQVRQHVVLSGSPTLPVSVASAPAASASAPVAADRALQDIRAGSDSSYTVKLIPSKPTLRIGQDMFEFEVDTNREGYLYIFQVGSDGKTFNLLFPNKVDSMNRVSAGRHSFPRPSWALKAGGPAGKNHLMALLSSTPKNFADVAKQAEVFASLPATRNTVKSLIVVSTGSADGQQGRYGTSDVVAVVEAP